MQEFDHHFQPIALERSKKFISESQPSVYYALHQSAHDAELQETIKHFSFVHSKTSLTQSLYTEPADNQSINLFQSDHCSKSNPSHNDHGPCRNGYVVANVCSPRGNSKNSDDSTSPKHRKNEGYIGKGDEMTSSMTPSMHCKAENNSVATTSVKNGYTIQKEDSSTSLPLNIESTDTLLYEDLSTAPTSIATCGDAVFFEFGVLTRQESVVSYQECSDFSECAVSFDFGGSRSAEDDVAISFTLPKFSLNRSQKFMTKSLNDLVACKGRSTMAANGYVVQKFSISNSNQDVELMNLYSEHQ